MIKPIEYLEFEKKQQINFTWMNYLLLFMIISLNSSIFMN